MGLTHNFHSKRGPWHFLRSEGGGQKVLMMIFFALHQTPLHMLQVFVNVPLGKICIDHTRFVMLLLVQSVGPNFEDEVWFVASGNWLRSVKSYMYQLDYGRYKSEIFADWLWICLETIEVMFVKLYFFCCETYIWTDSYCNIKYSFLLCTWHSRT